MKNSLILKDIENLYEFVVLKSDRMSNSRRDEEFNWTKITRDMIPEKNFPLLHDKDKSGWSLLGSIASAKRGPHWTDQHNTDKCECYWAVVDGLISLSKIISSPNLILI